LNFLFRNARWLAAATILTLLSSFGQTFFISLFGKEIRGEFALSDGQFGLLYMGATLVSALVLMFLGKVVDRWPMSTSIAMVTGALAMTCFFVSFNHSLVGLGVSLFLLRLIGQGMMTHTAQTAVGKWFDRDRGTAISVTSLGHNLGEASLPLVVAFCFDETSWRWAWICSGVLVLVLLPTCSLLAKKERQCEHDSESTESPAVRDWTRGEVIRDKWFWISGIGLLAPAFIATAIYFHHEHLVSIKGWAEGTFANGFLVLSVTTVVTKLIAGFLIDRFSAARLMWFSLVPLGASCLVLSFGKPEWVIYLAMFLVAMSMGCSNSVFGTLWPEIYGTKHLGAIRAVAFSGVVFASACGTGVTGWLLDSGIGFEKQLLVMAIWCGLGAGLLMVVARALLARAEKPVVTQ